MLISFAFLHSECVIAHCPGLEKNGLENQAGVRWAGRVADGAEHGIAEMQGAELQFDECPRELLGQIDAWHCAERGPIEFCHFSPLALRDPLTDAVLRSGGCIESGLHGACVSMVDPS